MFMKAKFPTNFHLLDQLRCSSCVTGNFDSLQLLNERQLPKFILNKMDHKYKGNKLKFLFIQLT